MVSSLDTYCGARPRAFAGRFRPSLDLVSSMLEQAAHRRRYWIFALAATALWVAVAFAVAPRVIASAYAGRSLATLNAMLSGRGVHPLADYLSYWRYLARIK